MKKLNRLPEAELTVMRAVWRLEPPFSPCWPG